MKSNVILPTYYQQFIHKSRYARWLDDENRREEWHETVGRYVNFMSSHLLNLSMASLGGASLGS